jgi:flavin-binding protein dodecin
MGMIRFEVTLAFQDDRSRSKPWRCPQLARVAFDAWGRCCFRDLPVGLVIASRGNREGVMSDHVYKKVELVGSSKSSVTEAIETAIARASKTMRNLEWFEVDQIRGHIKDGEVAHYQVVMKVGFRIDD